MSGRCYRCEERIYEGWERRATLLSFDLFLDCCAETRLNGLGPVDVRQHPAAVLSQPQHVKLAIGYGDNQPLPCELCHSCTTNLLEVLFKAITPLSALAEKALVTREQP